MPTGLGPPNSGLASGTRGMALDQHLALEGIPFRRVAAGVVKIGIAADDLAIPEDDHAATFAGSPILQADVDRIQTVHDVAAGYDLRHSGVGSAVMPKRGRWRQRDRFVGRVAPDADLDNRRVPFSYAYFLSRSNSSIEMPCGPRMKQMRTPGRMVVGSLVNSTPLALISAATASMSFTVNPK